MSKGAILFLSMVVTVTIVVVGGLFLFSIFNKTEQQGNTVAQADYKNTSYIIEGNEVKLVNGYSEIEAAPGSVSKIIIRYFGNEAQGDLNNDGISDVAFLLTQESGGSGTFYYVVAALKTTEGYQGTNAVFLGDRILPETTEIKNGQIVVKYGVRRDGSLMTGVLSLGAPRYFIVKDTNLIEIILFGSPINFNIGKEIIFEDGLTVQLTAINDSQCKPGMVCVWAGELAPVLLVLGGTVGNTIEEVNLGTQRNKTLDKYGYTFEFIEATKTSATIMINKESLNNPGACYVGGCSSEICSDQKDIVSICLYKEEYACYKTATCVRQTNGQCGWTMTQELTTCLETK